MSKKIKWSWKLRIKKNSTRIHQVESEFKVDVKPRLQHLEVKVSRLQALESKVKDLELWINTFHPKNICKNFEEDVLVIKGEAGK